MAHFVFAAPGIDRFALHERLRRELLRREHRVTVLCGERREFTFWRQQFAGVEHVSRPRAGSRARRANRLEAAAASWLELERPDLVMIHQRRTRQTLALERAARATGCEVMWTGDGLLPHTMQVDQQGLDGAASSLAQRAQDLRVVSPDDCLLETSLAYALSGHRPLALPIADVRKPSRALRLRDAAAYVAAGRLREALRALTAWDQALPQPEADATEATQFDLEPPFVAALLQRADDPRVLLDAAEPPTAAALIEAAVRAADQLQPGAQVAVVAPPGARSLDRAAERLCRTRGERIRLLAHDAAGLAAATAASVITVNHPAASIGLLAGTPVLHTGRALYELDGVSLRTSAAELAEDHQRALARPRPALRRRFLTWLLRYGHLWCSAATPNFNGMLGLVALMEQRASAGRATQPNGYRPGPAWPLSPQAAMSR